MYVYSGNCRKCETGLPTGLTDIVGKPLFTGDIVVIYTEDNDGKLSYFPDDLTVVVIDQWQSFANGTHVLREAQGAPFVMGIKDAVNARLNEIAANTRPEKGEVE